MHRLRFSKTGDAIWISHLDTMRLFQRAFRRAGLAVKSTEGFNPHAFVSVALPMSVGTVSQCELLDFTLTQADCTLDQVPELLNRVLPAGVRVLEAYDSPSKPSGIRYLRAQVTMTYDRGVPDGAAEQVQALFQRPQLVIAKKTKKGVTDTDIRPMLREITVSQPDRADLVLQAVVCANEPSLNPDLLGKCVALYLPELACDDARSCRLEVLDAQGELFR